MKEGYTSIVQSLVHLPEKPLPHLDHGDTGPDCIAGENLKQLFTIDLHADYLAEPQSFRL
jgi:hypothetical protein